MKTSLNKSGIQESSIHVHSSEFNIPLIQPIPCPNCGSSAQRKHLVKLEQTKIECPSCDYLLLTCSRTGRVKEAYAPGIYWGNGRSK
ncbi:hypothetical protein [Roseofilum capinflatum]|uniref:hypothetical protein n=1 Tax=Roseofilum capinflatum TaxID=3082943 RepID=UPI0024BD6524|nr:hypothetical protein [Roseofilum capinflatum]